MLISQTVTDGVMPIHRKALIGFRMMHSYLTSTHSTGPGEATFDFEYLVIDKIRIVIVNTYEVAFCLLLGVFTFNLGSF